jgi:hypothetical protein
MNGARRPSLDKAGFLSVTRAAKSRRRKARYQMECEDRPPAGCDTLPMINALEAQVWTTQRFFRSSTDRSSCFGFPPPRPNVRVRGPHLCQPRSGCHRSDLQSR